MEGFLELLHKLLVGRQHVVASLGHVAIALVEVLLRSVRGSVLLLWESLYSLVNLPLAHFQILLRYGHEFVQDQLLRVFGINLQQLAADLRQNVDYVLLNCDRPVEYFVLACEKDGAHFVLQDFVNVELIEVNQLRVVVDVLTLNVEQFLYCYDMLSD